MILPRKGTELGLFRALTPSAAKRRTGTVAAYSYPSASIGSRMEARRAGQIPKNKPTAAEKTSAVITASNRMAVSHPATCVMISDAP